MGDEVIAFRSSRVLLEDDDGEQKFLSASVICSQGKVIAILKGNGDTLLRGASRVVDYADSCLGPGLVDVGVDVCVDGWKGGVTTIVTKGDGTQTQSLNVYKFKTPKSKIEFNTLNLLLLESPKDVTADIYVCADPPTALSSPFHGRTDFERKLLPGIPWRTGRSRKGSGNESILFENRDDADLDGVKMPSEMVQVLLERERESYITTLPAAPQAMTSAKRRPAPIAATKIKDSFSPAEFLQDYRVHLSLRPVFKEVEGVQQAIESKAKAILRISSKEALESSSSSPLMGGTTVAHLFFAAADIRPGLTWLKLNPPLRHESDRVALLSQAISKGDGFCISSGHTVRLECFPDFERTASNGPCMEWSLPALWTICSRMTCEDEKERMQHFATLWARFSRIPSDLVGLSHKGRIQVGCDADFVVFNTRSGTRVVDAPSVFQGQQLIGQVERVFIGQSLVNEEL